MAPDPRFQRDQGPDKFHSTVRALFELGGSAGQLAHVMDAYRALTARQRRQARKVIRRLYDEIVLTKDP